MNYSNKYKVQIKLCIENNILQYEEIYGKFYAIKKIW